MKKLSIIIPVFNVEKYLSKCIDSLLAQNITLNDYEMIIINDGSTDDSFSVAKKYANQYSNIKLLSQENKGLGAARNAGIREAVGKYMFFVDSDDFIQSFCLKELLDCIENKKLDLLRFNYKAISPDGQSIPKTRNSIYSTIYSEKIVDGKAFLANYLGWACYVWLFIFDSSFIRNNNLLFNETIYFEDVEWMVRVLTVAKRVRSIDKCVYFYLHRLDSITQSIKTENKEKIITDKLYVVNFLKVFPQSFSNKYVSLWCNGMISLTFMGILAFVENELPERKNEIINLLITNDYLPLKSYRFTLKQKRDLFIININPRLYCYLKRIKN